MKCKYRHDLAEKSNAQKSRLLFISSEAPEKQRKRGNLKKGSWVRVWLCSFAALIRKNEQLDDFLTCVSTKRVRFSMRVFLKLFSFAIFAHHHVTFFFTFILDDFTYFIRLLAFFWSSFAFVCNRCFILRITFVMKFGIYISKNKQRILFSLCATTRCLYSVSFCFFSAAAWPECMHSHYMFSGNVIDRLCLYKVYIGLAWHTDWWGIGRANERVVYPPYAIQKHFIDSLWSRVHSSYFRGELNVLFVSS